MDPPPKISPWKLPTIPSNGNSSAISPVRGSIIQGVRNLAPDSWPELGKSPVKAPPPISTLPKAPIEETHNPKNPSLVKTTPQRGKNTPEDSPTPRARGGKRANRRNRSISQAHEVETPFSLNSPRQPATSTKKSQASAPAKRKQPLTSTTKGRPPSSTTKTSQTMSTIASTDRAAHSRSISQIHDVPTLLTAVEDDAQTVFERIHSLVQENQELKAMVKSMTEQLEYERQHLKTTIEGYEELVGVGKSKQVLLWEFINRLQSGEGSAHTSSLAASTTTGDGGIEDMSFTPKGGFVKDNIELDPNAQAFIPSTTTTSPKKSPKKSSGHNKKAAQTQHAISSLAKTTSTTVFTTGAPPSTKGTPNPPHLTPEVIALITETIPPAYRIICPFALSEGVCPLKDTCPQKDLCSRFASEDTAREGCQSKDPKKPICRQIHERQTCVGELDGRGCKFRGPTKGKKNSEVEAKRLHLKSKAHRSNVPAEEWRIREAVAGLREAHKLGLYSG